MNRLIDLQPDWLKRNPVLQFAAASAVLFAAVIVIAVVAFGSSGASKKNESSAEGESAGLLADQPPAAEGKLELPPPTTATVEHLTSVGPDDRFIVSKFKVDAPLTYRLVGLDGQMPNPDGPDDISYYDFSNWPGKGGAPGKSGNAVFAGHVDSGTKACKNGTVKPPCQAVLWDLNQLKVGDEIELRVASQSYKFEVTTNQSLNAETAPWADIVGATAKESITIITCGGDFNRETRSYSNRQVVVAVRKT